MRSCGKVAGNMQVTGEQVTWAGDWNGMWSYGLLRLQQALIV